MVLSVALSPTAPGWVTQHYCAGLGPFGRSAGIYAATRPQAAALQANPMLSVVVAKNTDAPEPPTSDLEADPLPAPIPARKKRV